MATQALTLPVDIPWRRFAYAADMIDTSFDDPALPPKWRSSMAVYYYVVPLDQTAESYPEGRIVYLRLTCSITGWNPIEELEAAVTLDNIGDAFDDWQKSVWEAIAAQDWASDWAHKYWPCRGAIAQIAVYPHKTDEVERDDYPFIFDFEPKKRELYETRTETSEYSSESNDSLSVQKGTTTLDSTEKTTIQSVSGGFGISVGGFGIGGSASSKYSITKSTGVESVDMQTTDTSRNRRETISHSTTLNQMYQLFNGYHLGTNRAVFVIAPRPHTISASESEEMEFNLIRGDRELEGLQDMFIVVHVPNKLKGICIQANLDTGHDFESGEFDYAPSGESLQARELVVTRRIIRNCGLYDENGNLLPTGVPGPAPMTIWPGIVFEDLVARPLTIVDGFLRQPSRAIMRLAALADTKREARSRVANQLNLYQRQVRRKMLDAFSNGRYKARPFVETKTFERLIKFTLANSTLNANQLAAMGYLTLAELERFQRAGVRTVGELFTEALEGSRDVDLQQLEDLRNRMINAVLRVAKPK